MEAVQRIEIKKAQQSRISEVDFEDIPFGRIFSDHMLFAEYSNGVWETADIRPYGAIQVFPSITALHYGQSVFEGMKATKSPEGDVLLFRPRDNYLRMNYSGERLCMPEIPEHIYMDGVKELVKLDQQWIPTAEGSSLYLRPVYFATDEYVGIKPSDNYKFIIFSCPVGAYYPEPVGLWVTKEYVRAFEGGTGDAKAAGNYASSLLGAKKAKEKGYDNVLWLDGIEKRYIEECGTMNIFFVINGVAVTPEITGTILNGITRDSAIILLKDMGVDVEERKVSIEEIVEAHHNGTLQEAFGSGTAATIAHVDKIGYEGEQMNLPAVEDRKIGPELLKRLSDIRTGKAEDPYGWIVRL